MLERAIKQAIPAYYQMESSRVGDNFGVRRSKKDIFLPLDNCDNDEKRCLAISKISNDLLNTQDGKHKLLINILQVCAKAISVDADYTSLLAEITILKNQIVKSNSILDHIPGMRSLTGNAQFDEACKVICQDIEEFIQTKKASNPALLAQKEIAVQAQVEFDNIFAQYEKASKQEEKEIQENERLKNLIAQLTTNQNVEGKESAELIIAQQQKIQITRLLAIHRDEVNALTEKLIELYHSKESLQTQCQELKTRMRAPIKAEIPEMQKPSAAIAAPVNAVVNLQNADYEKIEREAFLQEIAKLKKELAAVKTESDVKHSELSIKLAKEAAAQRELEKNAQLYEEEIRRSKIVSQKKLATLEEQSEDTLRRILIANDALKVDKAALVAVNTSMMAEFATLKEKLGTMRDNIDQKDREIHSLQQANKQLVADNQKYQHVSEEVTSYLKMLVSRFYYSEEEDNGLIKPGDIKKLIELAGADEVFLNRYQEFNEAIKHKIDSKKLSSHNGPYIIEQKLVENYFKKFIGAYDVLFKSSKSLLTVSAEDEKEVLEAAQKAEQMIVFHNKTERVFQQQVSYETSIKQLTAADLSSFEEANKSVRLNKCRAAFYEELLKRAENLLPKKSNPSVIADLAKRLSPFIARNMPALTAAVTAMKEKERKVAAMNRPSPHASSASVLFSAPVAALSKDMPASQQAPAATEFRASLQI